MTNEKKRRNAVARLLAGETKVEDEAQRLQVNKRTVERWLAAAKQQTDVAEDVGANVVSENATPSSEMPEGKPNPALDAALKGAGVAPEPSATPKPTAADTAMAREDMSKFCLDAIGQFKSATGSILITTRYSPPLDLGMSKVQDALKLSPLCEMAVRTNADKLYPLLVKIMGGPYQIAGALVIESLMLIVGLKSLAVSQGWKAPEQKKREAERYTPAVQTWPTAAPAHVPRVPEEGIRAVDASNGPFGVVADAPPAAGAAA